MTIEVICRCGQRYATADEYGGQTLTCPNCGGPLPVLQSPGAIPPGMEFCDFCHQYIPRGQMSAHVAEHLELQEDGQQSEYATLPEGERASEAEAAKAPKWYVHRKCGEVTGMPDEIIQTYLANPWFYLGDFTYCGGCEKHVPLRTCVWQDTGEDLQTYTNRLRAGKPELRPSIYIRMLAWFVRAFR